MEHNENKAIESKSKEDQAITLICPDCKLRIPKFFLKTSDSDGIKQFDAQVQLRVMCSCFKGEKLKSIDEFLHEISAKQSEEHQCKFHKAQSFKYCAKCVDWLCSKCIEYHDMFTQDHKLTESALNFQCKTHTKLFAYHCFKCSIDFCGSCRANHFNHYVEVLKPIEYEEFDFQVFDTEMSQTQKQIKNLIEKIDKKITEFTHMKEDIQSAFKKNQKTNQDLIRLYRSIKETIKQFSESPSYELWRLEKALIIDKTKFEEKDISIIEEYTHLKQFLNKNFVLKQQINIKENKDNKLKGISLKELNKNIQDNLELPPKDSINVNQLLKNNCLNNWLTDEVKKLFIMYYQNKIQSQNNSDIKDEIVPYCIVPYIQAFECIQPPMTSIKLFSHYSYSTIGDLYTFIKSTNAEYSNCILSFWEYKLKDKDKKKTYTCKYLSSDFLIQRIDKETILVCEYQNKTTFESNKNLQMASSDGRKGIIGLYNSKSCSYMTSTLQCLSNCDILTEYLVIHYNSNEMHQNYINKAKGQFANAYKDLLLSLWVDSTETSAKFVLFYTFEKALSKCCKEKQFSLTFQGDSYQFFCWILQIMAEDLDVVQQHNTYLGNTPQCDDDSALVKNLLAFNSCINQSIIIDLFSGLKKIVNNCSCGWVQKQFEFYMTIELPVKIYFINCIFIFYDVKQKPIEIKIPFESNKTFGYLRSEISELFSVNTDSFVFAEVKDEQILQLFNSKRKVNTQSVVYCFQIDPQIVAYNEMIKSLYFKDQSEIETIIKKVFSPVEYKSSTKIEFTNCKIKNDTIEVDIDNKYNLDDKYILLVLNIPIDDHTSASIQRIMFVDRTLPLNELYFKIKSYVDSLQSFQLLFNFNGKCIFCNQSNCQQCLFSKEKCEKLSTLLTTLKVNSYLYINTENRNCVEQTQFDAYEIEIVFNKDSNKEKNKYERYAPSKRQFDASYHLEYFLKQFITEKQTKQQLKCSKCNSLSIEQTKTLIYSCPNYLIIQLKRYNNVGSNDNERLITFPIDGLDMSPYVIEKEKSLIYDLISVINHYNYESNDYYSTYAKNCLDNKWRFFDWDGTVTLLDQNNIASNAAYILVYKRKYIEKEYDKGQQFEKKFTTSNSADQLD